MQRLEPKIIELLNNKSYKEKAEELSTKMFRENHRKEIHDLIIN